MDKKSNVKNGRKDRLEVFQMKFNNWLRIEDRTSQIIILIAVSLIIAYISIPNELKMDYPVSDKDVGKVLKYSVRANRDYTIVDDARSRKNRLESEKNVPAHYQVVDVDLSSRSLKKGFALLRQKLEMTILDTLRQSEGLPEIYLPLYAKTMAGDPQLFNSFEKKAEVVKELNTFRDEFQKIVGVPINDEVFSALIETLFSEKIEKAVENIHLRLGSYYISRDGIPPEYELGHIAVKKGDSIISVPLDKVISGENLREEIKYSQNVLQQTNDLTQKGLEVVASLAYWTIKDNIILSNELTEEKKLVAWNNAAREEFTIKNGEVVKRAGEVINKRDIMIFREMAKQSSGKSFLRVFLQNFIYILLLILIIHHSFKRTVSKYNSRNKDVLLLGLQTVFAFLLFNMIVSLSVPFSQWMGSIDARIFYFLMPVPFLIATVRLLVNTETALAFLLMLMGMFIIIFPDNLYFPIFYFIGSLLYIYLVTHIEKRGNIIKISFFLSLLLMVLTLMFFLMDSTLPADNLPRAFLMSFLGAMLSGLLIMGVIPIYEWLLGYTTDITFLEYSTLNHPLMKQMAVHANGTYQHSLTLASLVEAAAREVGLSSLACKVMAYFHDIGKLERPQYFTENQAGKNKHDELPSNSMSAMIIINHVKHGLDLARKYRLGEKIEDAVGQHHGTTLVEYFYRQAQKEDPDASESTYKYPGPKPRTRETALLMIADSAEAAVRSIPEKNFQKISDTVRKIVSKKLNEGQLSECNMTLKDLNIIEESLIKTLSGIYHARVEYPE